MSSALVLPSPLAPIEFALAEADWELDELEEDELEDEETRLVDARRADDMFDLEELEALLLELAFEVPALEATLTVAVEEELDPERSRPKPERLPRIWGLSNEA